MVKRPSSVRPSVQFSKHYYSYAFSQIFVILVHNGPQVGGHITFTQGGATWCLYGSTGATRKNTKNATPPTNPNRFSNRWCQIIANPRGHQDCTLLVAILNFGDLVKYRIFKILDFFMFSVNSQRILIPFVLFVRAHHHTQLFFTVF